EHDARAVEPLRLRVDVAALDADLGAHRLEPGDVQVDRALADGAAARQRHARLAVPRDQRAEHKDGRAHGLDQLVGRDRRREPARVHLYAYPDVDPDRDAPAAEQLNQRLRVVQLRRLPYGRWRA